MRQLSQRYLDDLTSGHLLPLLDAVRKDDDLDMEIRERYINVYYKGNALLKLDERRRGRYPVAIHEKFTQGLDVPAILDDVDATTAFVDAIPMLKRNIGIHGRSSLETEYEQMVIRANNAERRNNSDYFIVDRQIVVPEGRFDLTGICWRGTRRARGQVVDPCLIEIKFALNSDISEVDQQLARYYDAVRPRAPQVAEKIEVSLKQKLTLGLIDQAQNRLDAMATVTVARELERFQFILLLVDYNPRSAKLDLDKLKALPFADQVRIYSSGFAMWEHNVRPVAELV